MTATALALLGLFAGLAGAYYPRADASTTVFSLRVNPGTAFGYLTCSWHGGPCGSGSGRALDWGHPSGGAASEGSTVYWRSWGYRSDTGSYSTIGWVTVSVNNSVCRRVSAWPFNNLSNNLGRVDYTHTVASSGSWFYIPGNYNNYYLSVSIATVGKHSEELAGCASSAAHLHQDDGYSSFTYQSSNFGTTYQYYSITGINDWQYYTSWYY